MKARFVLFGGGEAGRMAHAALASSYPDEFAGLVWDPMTGDPPLTAAPQMAIENCTAGVDFVLCSGYGRILRSATLERFPRGGFNAHPSVLPSYRGRHAIQWQIANGEREFGVTIHRMTVEIDRGDLVMVCSCPCGIDMDYLAISQRLAKLAAEMLVQLVARIRRGERLAPLPPNGREDRYYRLRQPEDSRIDWNAPTARILDQVRACAPAYAAYAQTARGDKVRFLGYHLRPARARAAGEKPGEVLIIVPEGCAIATQDSAIWLIPDRSLMAGEVLR